MYFLVSILILIAAVLLILIVLVQNSKGGGLSSTFASNNQIMGVRKTADFLEKATWSLAIAVVVLSIVASMTIDRGSKKKESLIKEQVNSAPAPAVPNMQQTQSNQGKPAQTGTEKKK